MRITAMVDRAPQVAARPDEDAAGLIAIVNAMGDGPSTRVPTSILPLLIWLSPAFPVGSFAYSHALEWAVHTGAITNLATATAWLRDLMAHGGPRNDCIVLAAAWRAAKIEDSDALAEANDLALALAGSRERYLETTAQGNAFATAIATAWSSTGVKPTHGLTGDVAYPVAIAAATAAHDMALSPVLEAFGLAAIANLSSALVRLNVIGQSDGQRLIAALLSDVFALAADAATSNLDDTGGCAFHSDIASLKHEMQTFRVFRT